MYYHITKLVYLLPLSEDVILHILNLAGYVRLRNGKYYSQLNRNYKIFRKVKELPRFQNWKVHLPIKTAWFRKAFCDKIIILGNIYYCDNNGPTIGRSYKISWFEYDYDGEMHDISSEKHLLVLQNQKVIVIYKDLIIF